MGTAEFEQCVRSNLEGAMKRAYGLRDAMAADGMGGEPTMRVEYVVTVTDGRDTATVRDAIDRN